MFKYMDADDIYHPAPHLFVLAGVGGGGWGVTVGRNSYRYSFVL